jgi:alkylation response protein AidB-like acyl-CoA dehydrogenase
MGPKQGLNGVDNGQLWFDSLRVPRDALLDAYGQVRAVASECLFLVKIWVSTA